MHVLRRSSGPVRYELARKTATWAYSLFEPDPAVVASAFDIFLPPKVTLYHKYVIVHNHSRWDMLTSFLS